MLNKDIDQLIESGITISFEKDTLQKELNRLAPYIDDFKYLSTINSWQDIKEDKSVCQKLQEAYDIMKATIYPRNHRCVPCEMTGLCAIKYLSGVELKDPYPPTEDEIIQLRESIEKYWDGAFITEGVTHSSYKD